MDTDQILLAVTVVITVTVVAGGIAKRLSLGPIVALLAVGAALGPHSPYPLLADYVDEMEAVGEVGVVLLLFLVGIDIQPAWPCASMSPTMPAIGASPNQSVARRRPSVR